MAMAYGVVPGSLIRIRNVLIVKQYGKKYKAIWSSVVRKKGFEALDDPALPDALGVNPFTGESYYESDFRWPGQYDEGLKLENNISRAKSKIFEYAFCNDWDYFVTLTIDKEKLDRYDLHTYVKKLGQFISNYKKNHGSKFNYLLVPEKHEDGAYHMHGLISGILPKHLVINEHGYLDFPLYRDRFGFISMSEVRDHEAVSKYITKYVTKEFLNSEKGANSYYCSKGLNRSVELYRVPDIDADVLEWDFEHPEGFCKTLMVDDLSVILEATGGIIS